MKIPFLHKYKSCQTQRYSDTKIQRTLLPYIISNSIEKLNTDFIFNLLLLASQPTTDNPFPAKQISIEIKKDKRWNLFLDQQIFFCPCNAFAITFCFLFIHFFVNEKFFPRFVFWNWLNLFFYLNILKSIFIFMHFSPEPNCTWFMGSMWLVTWSFILIHSSQTKTCNFHDCIFMFILFLL